MYGWLMIRYIKTLIQLDIFGCESGKWLFRPSIALVNHHEGFMTLFVTSHTAKRYKMKATACKKWRDKIVNKLVQQQKHIPFCISCESSIINRILVAFSWCFEIFQWDWDPIWPNINLLYFQILFLYLLTLWCDAGLWTTFICFLRLNFYFDIDTSTKMYIDIEFLHEVFYTYYTVIHTV